MQKKVFISFSSKDAKIAQSICTALEARGHRCWTSGRDVTPGENYQGAIVRAIRDAGVMVMVFSTNANNSDEIKKELALASQTRLMVIPVRAEDVVPGEDFTYELATRQWIDLFQDWEQSIEQLGRKIDGVISREVEPWPVCGAETAEAPKPDIPTPKAAPAAAGRSRLPLVIAGGLAVLVAAGGAWLMRPAPPPPPAAMERQANLSPTR